MWHIIAYFVVYAIGWVIGHYVGTRKYKSSIAGALVADKRDPSVDRYTIVLDIPLEELDNRNSVLLAVKKA